MKAVLEVEFDSPAQAKQALSVLRKADKTLKSEVLLSVDGFTLKASVSAPRFAVLRARTTSLLRDLKVVRDAFGVK